MALEDFADPEVGIAIAVTALAASPQARNMVRRGLVVGLASIMRAGDAVTGAARGMAEGAQQAAASTGSVVQQATTEARTETVKPRAARRTDGALENE